MLRLTRPTDAELQRLADASTRDQFTYTEVGATARANDVPGYRRERFEVQLGVGDAVFSQAVEQLREWRPQRGSGLSLAATGTVQRGTTVAMAAPLPVGFVIAACKVVYVETTPDRFAFAYGTLAGHPEQGEERFEVSQHDGVVTFVISVFSKPRHPMARLAAPIARRLQRSATLRYLDAMRTAVPE